MSQGDLMAAVTRRTPAKLSPVAIQSLTKFYIGFLENDCLDLVGDLVDFHAHHVDPKELCVSTSFIQSLVSEQSLVKCPYIRMYLVCTQYTTEKVKVQAGGPSVSMFLEPSIIGALCKKPDVLEVLETQLREIKKKYLPLLVHKLGERTARLELAVGTSMFHPTCV